MVKGKKQDIYYGLKTQHAINERFINNSERLLKIIERQDQQIESLENHVKQSYMMHVTTATILLLFFVGSIVGLHFERKYDTSVHEALVSHTNAINDIFDGLKNHKEVIEDMMDSSSGVRVGPYMAENIQDACRQACQDAADQYGEILDDAVYNGNSCDCYIGEQESVITTDMVGL